jgi:hypothetical protein
MLFQIISNTYCRGGYATNTHTKILFLFCNWEYNKLSISCICISEITIPRLYTIPIPQNKLSVKVMGRYSN